MFVIFLLPSLLVAKPIQLTKNPSYLQRGFEIDWTTKKESELGIQWTQILKKSNYHISIEKIPFLAMRPLLGLDPPNLETFTLITYFDFQTKHQNGLFYGLYLEHIGDNYEIYLNGTRISHQRISIKNNKINLHKTSFQLLQPFNSELLVNGSNVLVFKIVGDPLDKNMGVRFGDKHHIDILENQQRNTVSWFQPVIFAVTLLLGFYFLYLWFKIKDSFYLVFGIFSILWSISMLHLSPWVRIHYNDQHQADIIFHTLLFSSAAFHFMFFELAFRNKVYLFIKILCIVCFCLCLFSIFATPRQLTQIMNVFIFCEIPTIIYFFYQWSVKIRLHYQAYNQTTQYKNNKKIYTSLRYILLRTFEGNISFYILIVSFSLILETVINHFFGIVIHFVAMLAPSYVLFFAFIIANRIEEKGRFFELYRDLIELLPDMTIITVKDKVVFSNQASLEMAGVNKSDELLGRRALDIFQDNNKKELHNALTQFYDGSQTVFKGEFTLHNKKKSKQHVYLTVLSFAYEGAPALQFVANDITKRVLAQKKINFERQLRHQAETELKLTKERHMIYADIHDNLSADLTDIGLLLQRAQDKEIFDHNIIFKLKGLLSRTKNQLSRRLHDLGDLSEFYKNFVYGLHLSLVRRYSKAGRQIRFDAGQAELVHEKILKSLSQSQLRDLFQLFQEIITNDLKYGKNESQWFLRNDSFDNSVCIELKSESNYIEEVKKDGYGSHSIQNRIERLNLEFKESLINGIYEMKMIIKFKNE